MPSLCHTIFSVVFFMKCHCFSILFFQNILRGNLRACEHLICYHSLLYEMVLLTTEPKLRSQEPFCLVHSCMAFTVVILLYYYTMCLARLGISYMQNSQLPTGIATHVALTVDLHVL
jgi:hypothetical protein